MLEIWKMVGQSETLQAIGIGALILAFGFRLLTNLKPDSQHSRYVGKIFALIVILPVVLTLALTAKFPIEAVTGLLGTIVSFFFGVASTAPQRLHGDRIEQKRRKTWRTQQSRTRCPACPRVSQRIKWRVDGLA
jgi:hypothetical protein